MIFASLYLDKEENKILPFSFLVFPFFSSRKRRIKKQPFSFSLTLSFAAGSRSYKFNSVIATVTEEPRHSPHSPQKIPTSDSPFLCHTIPERKVPDRQSSADIVRHFA
jgi:hypothetical protein